ncbi:hypothetical protein BUALT_Bualt10G0018000 [Buddleja alternifolia]|uniref:Uncharacterized protein n=1 Tax=Buddleja alternifolia TaxID=168488 RepID=A0AAV6WX31_9LAMI|nr:hypothetical protein BUALT_Bualt10G0018000 [Buddleja alternifolia]
MIWSLWSFCTNSTTFRSDNRMLDLAYCADSNCLCSSSSSSSMAAREVTIPVGFIPPPRLTGDMEDSDEDRPLLLMVTPNQRKKKLKRHLVGVVSPTITTANPNADVPPHAQVQDSATEKRWCGDHLKNTWSRKVSSPSYYTGESEIDEFEQVNDMEENYAEEGGDTRESRIPEGSLSEEEIQLMEAPYRWAGDKEDPMHKGNTEAKPTNNPVFYFGQGSSQTRNSNALKAADVNSTGANLCAQGATNRGKNKIAGTERNKTGSRYDILNDLGEEEIREVEVTWDSELRKNNHKATAPASKRRIFKERTTAQQNSVVHIERVKPIKRGTTYPIVNNRISSQVKDEELLDKTLFTRAELDEIYGIGGQQIATNPSSSRTHMGTDPRAHEPPGDSIIDSDENADSEGVDIIDSVLNMQWITGDVGREKMEESRGGGGGVIYTKEEKRGGMKIMENPFTVKVGQVFTGFGVGCGIGIGVGRPLNLGAIPVLNQVMVATRGATDAFSGVQRHLNNSIFCLKAAAVCPALFDIAKILHDMAGLAVKPSVLHQIQSHVLQLATGVMTKLGIGSSSTRSINQGIFPASLQTGTSMVKEPSNESSGGSISQLVNSVSNSTYEDNIRDVKTIVSPEKTLAPKSVDVNTQYSSRTEKVLNDFLKNLKEEGSSRNEQVGTLQLENNMLQMVLKHQILIEELMQENEKLRKILVEELKVQPTKLQSSFTSRSRNLCSTAVENKASHDTVSVVFWMRFHVPRNQFSLTPLYAVSPSLSNGSYNVWRGNGSEKERLVNCGELCWSRDYHIIIVEDCVRHFLRITKAGCNCNNTREAIPTYY